MTRWLALLTGIVAVCFALSTNVASGLVPGAWAKNHETLVWIVFAALAALTVVLVVVSAGKRPDAGGATTQSVVVGAGREMGQAAGQPIVVTGPGSQVTVSPTGAEPAPAGRPGQIVIGELPGTPPAFVARAEVEHVRDVFASGEDVAVVCALAGGRGVGKTQVAAAYAREAVRAGVALVAWVSAESRESLLTGLAAVAERLGVADPEGDSRRSAERVRDYLATRSDPAVLVFDNATDLATLRPYVPATGAVRVVVTSTEREFTELGTPVDVGRFTRDESLAYLAERTRRDDHVGADALAEELDDLPLGLAHAATLALDIPYSECLDRLRSFTLDDALPPGRGATYPRGAAEAILLSVTRAEREHDSGFVTRVLDTVALLASEGVSRERLIELLRAEDADARRRVTNAVRLLVDTSLLVLGTDETIVMHRLVARTLQDRMERQEELRATIESLAGALADVLVPPDRAWAERASSEDLVAHTTALWEHAVMLTRRVGVPASDMPQTWAGVQWAVKHLNATADLALATNVGHAVLVAASQLLGGEHRVTLVARNEAALVHQAAGDLGRALPLYEESLAVSERIFGPDHPDTLTFRNNLASAYQDVGNLTRATELYEQNLTDSERILGPDHPDTLTSRNNLASAYGQGGDHGRAVPHLEEAVNRCHRVLGPDHPQTKTLAANLEAARQALADAGE